MKGFEYHAPATLDEALGLLAEHGDDAKLIAGGTALVIMMKQQLVQPAHLINLQRVRELAGIRERDDGLSILALTSQRDAEMSPVVRRHAPALAETFRKVATVRIRNSATVGGNLAHGDPALDPPAMLTALDARVRLTSREGDRWLPLDELYLDYYETQVRPDEILTELLVPYSPPRTAATYIKFLPRTEDDYATVGVAVRLTLDQAGECCEDARIALCAAGSTTLRAREAEALLRGQPATEAAFREAGAIARGESDPISDIRGSAEYKQEMVEVFVRRALLRALQELRDGGGHASSRNGLAHGEHAP